MKNLKHLKDEELLACVKDLACRERNMTIEVLWYLAEIDSRLLYAEQGFCSLYDYCVRELRYSAGTAARRIHSMRLLRKIPSLEQSIASGSLTLTNLSLGAQFFREQRKKQQILYSLEEKERILRQLESKSFRDASKVLREISPQTLKFESARVIDSNRTELTIQISDELYEKLEYIKAHCVSQLDGSAKYADLLNLMADKMIKEIKKNRGVDFEYNSKSS